MPRKQSGPHMGLRKALRARFPRTRFRVYDHQRGCTVFWTDGPSLTQVQAVTRRHKPPAALKRHYTDPLIQRVLVETARKLHLPRYSVSDWKRGRLVTVKLPGRVRVTPTANLHQLVISKLARVSAR